MFVRIASLAAVSAISLPASAQKFEDVLVGRGMWVQTPRKFDARMVNQLQDMGVRRAHVMLTSEPKVLSSCTAMPALRQTAATDKLAAIPAALARNKIAVIGTVYAVPDKRSIDKLTDPIDGLLATLLKAGYSAFEFDLEGQWSKSKVCGFAEHAAAVDYLLGRTRSLSPGLKAGITTHLGRAADASVGLKYADWVSMQAYTKCNPTDCAAYDGRDGPGQRQLRMPKAFDYSGPIIMGLGAHFQKWPGKTEKEAMRRALDATYGVQKTHPNVVGYSYWSTSWASQPPQFDFLKSTSKELP